MLGQAVVMFTVTNIDDLVLLTVFFGQVRDTRRLVLSVAVGQYLGFGAILVVSVLGALGATMLPESVVPYLGLVPLLLGIRAALAAWRERRSETGEVARPPDEATGVLQIAAVTFANGSDNIGVYVPVFAVASTSGMAAYVAVFLVGIAVWCVAGWFLARRPLVTRALVRWGHVVLPVVLVVIGLVILVEGGAFGLG